MYYSSVNRGVFMTSPGRWTILLVMALGFIAIASGYNGIYLAVSLGMSIVIVSGILSEKQMKYYALEEILPVVAEPKTPFSVRFRAKNTSDVLQIYGIENLVIPSSRKIPKIQEKLIPLMKSTVVTLGPNHSIEVSGSCAGLRRGLHKEFLVVQRTLFPFGLLAKFKVSRLSTRISILPSYDESLATQLRKEIQKVLSGTGIDQQFHSHRPFTSRDSMRNVDWKKSAGRNSQQWVLKVYECVIEDFGVLLHLDWSVAVKLPDEAMYEAHLSKLRTACDIVRETGRKLILTDGDDRFWLGHDACVSVLVEAPRYQHRRRGIKTPTTEIASGNYLSLSVRGPVPQWGNTPIVIHV